MRVDDVGGAGRLALPSLPRAPYDEAALRALAAPHPPAFSFAAPRSFAFFRHEDAPTAPAYAERLRALLAPEAV